jgi:hypothetical protein
MHFMTIEHGVQHQAMFQVLWHHSN